jgi:hypothetical protein
VWSLKVSNAVVLKNALIVGSECVTDTDENRWINYSLYDFSIDDKFFSELRKAIT